MSHYFRDVKAGVLAVVNQSTKVKAIYDYEETKPSGYPAVTITPVRGEAEFLDTMRYQRDFGFRIMCYQERLEATPSGAEGILTDLVDELIALFEAVGNTTLSNTVVFTRPVSVNFGYLNVPDADVRSAEINLIARAAQ